MKINFHQQTLTKKQKIIFKLVKMMSEKNK